MAKKFSVEKKKSNEEFIVQGSRAVEVYKLAYSLARHLGTDEVSVNAIEKMMIKFNEEKVRPPMKLSGEGSLLTHVRRAIDFVSDNPESEPHLYSSTEVDRQNSESFIDGYAHCFGVFMGACEKSLRALDTTMSFYMEDDLGKYDDRVKELGLAHNAIRFAMAEMDQAYDEEMRELKSLWNLDGYIANID